MKKLLTLTMAILLSSPLGALAEEVVFATSQWPPYSMLEDGKQTGMNMEIVRELCKRLGFESKIQIFPWKRALMYVKKGEVDAIFSARHTQERAKFLYYPSEAINKERTIILALKGSGIKATKLDDLKGKTIGVVRGYAYGSEFNNHQGLKKMLCNDDDQLVRIFAKKRTELAAGMDEGSMRFLCKKAGIETEVVHVLEETVSYVAFSKAIGERGKILAEKFGEALRQLKKEGFIEKVQSKYF